MGMFIIIVLKRTGSYFDRRGAEKQIFLNIKYIISKTFNSQLKKLSYNIV